MTFRTPKEAFALANNTRYGLAASIWTENTNLALEAARQVKAGAVWVNSTNLFDAASGFGGYRESGFGREGGKEGLYEYVRPKWEERPRPQMDGSETGKWGSAIPARPAPINGHVDGKGAFGRIDRTAKLFIGGKQKRPDGNYTRPILRPITRSSAKPPTAIARTSVTRSRPRTRRQAGPTRAATPAAQIMYYIAENLNARADEFAARIAAMTGRSTEGRADRSRAVD